MMQKVEAVFLICMIFFFLVSIVIGAYRIHPGFGMMVIGAAAALLCVLRLEALD